MRAGHVSYVLIRVFTVSYIFKDFDCFFVLNSVATAKPIRLNLIGVFKPNGNSQIKGRIAPKKFIVQYPFF